MTSLVCLRACKAAVCLDKFKELLSTREGAEQVLNGLGIPSELADLDHNPHYMTREQRRRWEA